MKTSMSFSEQPPTTRTLHWNPPKFSFLKVNCDASYDLSSGLTGIALVLRDHAGTWRGGLVKCYAGKASSEAAKCLAFSHSVRWCVELQLPRIMLEMDLKGIDSYINKASHTISWENEVILLDAIETLTKFQAWEVSFVPRKCNKIVDTLAKYINRFRISKIWLDDPPSNVEAQLLSEKLQIHD
ncbi:uncharacterized protein LOC113272495 [Papaver somniferum]|uniref:uncharacterized protein LOC113272495 n=1 Tax=Papaver somniferum TaxID=3469 RepID=UPI000E6FA765|nr:uncharacterized protein LOC113272495 [Papaver somniferum]